MSDREASGEMTATEGAAGRALTDEEDWIDPELAAEYGRQILANLESM